MSAWNAATQQIVASPARKWDGYPGWLVVDCGCCAGIEWGDPGPRECRSCGGSGAIALHVESGVLAHYPGGPLCGVASLNDITQAVTEAAST